MDPTAFHTIIQLIRNGTFGLDDIEEIATRLEGEGESDAAHSVRAAMIEASVPADAEAQYRRSKFRVVASDGGNEQA